MRLVQASPQRLFHDQHLYYIIVNAVCHIVLCRVQCVCVLHVEIFMYCTVLPVYQLFNAVLCHMLQHIFIAGRISSNFFTLLFLNTSSEYVFLTTPFTAGIQSACVVDLDPDELQMFELCGWKSVFSVSTNTSTKVKSPLLFFCTPLYKPLCALCSLSEQWLVTWLCNFGYNLECWSFSGPARHIVQQVLKCLTCDCVVCTVFCIHLKQKLATVLPIRKLDRFLQGNALERGMGIMQNRSI